MAKDCKRNIASRVSLSIVAESCCSKKAVLFHQMKQNVASSHYFLQGDYYSPLFASPVRSSWRRMQKRALLPQQRKRLPPKRALLPRRGHPLRRRPSPKIPRWRPHLSLQPGTSPPGLHRLPYENIFMHQAHQHLAGSGSCSRLQQDHFTQCCSSTDGVDVPYTM